MTKDWVDATSASYNNMMAVIYIDEISPEPFENLIYPKGAGYSSVSKKIALELKEWTEELKSKNFGIIIISDVFETEKNVKKFEDWLKFYNISLVKSCVNFNKADSEYDLDLRFLKKVRQSNKNNFNVDTASAKDLIEFISTDLEFLLSSGIQETPAADENIASIFKWWKEYKNWLTTSNNL